MSNYISVNRALTDNEMRKNARYVYDFLCSRGFTHNSAVAIIANAQDESRVNAGAWQNYKVNYNMGYGLLQWTPSTKLTSWLEENGYTYDNLYAQCCRIIWELENNKQYYKTKAYPLTFSEFKTSTKDAGWLAMAFMHNYERPANLNQFERMEYAYNWDKYFRKRKVELMEGIVTGNRVRIRDKAGLDGNILKHVNSGERLEIIETGDEWTKVKVEVEAYISSKYLK